MAEERLQKIISQAGIASRRKAETLILEGRVRVNGQVVVELGSKADAERDHIKVDGKLLKPATTLVYLAMNKPREVVTTLSDPEGRKTVTEYLRGLKVRVYPVGRLDYHSEGLLLFTNDGEFANRILSKASNIVKTYVVKANGTLTLEQMAEFRSGVPLSGKRTKPAGLKILSRANNPWYEVQLTEGRQNQIRMMFKHFGLLVEKLKRVKIGFLELGPLKPGEVRHLTPAEVAKFRHLLKLDQPEAEEGEPIVRDTKPRDAARKPSRQPARKSAGKPAPNPAPKSARKNAGRNSV